MWPLNKDLPECNSNSHPAKLLTKRYFCYNSYMTVASNIGDAKDARLKTAGVQTGKYREDFVKQTGIS